MCFVKSWWTLHVWLSLALSLECGVSERELQRQEGLRRDAPRISVSAAIRAKYDKKGQQSHCHDLDPDSGLPPTRRQRKHCEFAVGELQSHANVLHVLHFNPLFLAKVGVLRKLLDCRVYTNVFYLIFLLIFLLIFHKSACFVNHFLSICPRSSRQNDRGLGGSFAGRCTARGRSYFVVKRDGTTEDEAV
eukprot:gene4026-biopygen1519